MTVVALVAIHEHGGFQQSLFVFLGYGQEAMLIGVDQLPWFNVSPKDFHACAPGYGCHVSVSDAKVGERSL